MMANDMVGDNGTGAPSRFNMLGRSALITGSSGMLGRQHAAALLEVGAYVVLTDVDVDGLGSRKGDLFSVGRKGKVRRQPDWHLGLHD